MRLLHTRGNVPRLREFIGEHSFPPFAILSHTWDGEEVSLQEHADPAECVDKKGFAKIQRARALAAQNGFDYIWIDTCCIDKQASAELSEAINSMFRWYEIAAVCYAFLSDLAPRGVNPNPPGALQSCRWFRRGWTLQELIAPSEVLFYDQDWNHRGTKSELSGTISSITKIPVALLRRQTQLSSYSVACRMSWASRRETTRIEDLAYCLLGIFDVNMPLIYGERMKAFTRLQEAILQATGDLSILAWVDDRPDRPEYAGFLAESPSQFARCSEVEANEDDSVHRSLRITPRGIEMETGLAYLYKDGIGHQAVLDILSVADGNSIGVHLRKIGGSRYVRWEPGRIVQFRPYTTELDTNLYSTDFYIRNPSHSQESVVYDATQFSFTTVSLLTKLQANPGRQGTNLVLANRHSAVQLLPGSVDRKVKITYIQMSPDSNWDNRDNVFSCTAGAGRCWAAWAVRVKADAPGRQPVSFDLIVACFFWNSQNPLLAFGSATSFTGYQELSSLRFSLARIKFGDWLEADMTIKGTFGQHLRTGEEELVVSSPGGIDVVLSFRTNWKTIPALCVNPVLDIRLMASVRQRTWGQ